MKLLHWSRGQLIPGLEATRPRYERRTGPEVVVGVRGAPRNRTRLMIDLYDPPELLDGRVHHATLRSTGRYRAWLLSDQADPDPYCLVRVTTRWSAASNALDCFEPQGMRLLAAHRLSRHRRARPYLFDALIVAQPGGSMRFQSGGMVWRLWSVGGNLHTCYESRARQRYC